MTDDDFMWLQCQPGRAARAIEAHIRMTAKVVAALHKQVGGSGRRAGVTDEEMDVIEELRQVFAAGAR